jgi:hypothetical protein
MHGRAALVPLLLWSACAILFPSPAHAQLSGETAAETLFRTGRDAAKRGDLLTACKLFLESYTLDRKNGTLLNLALCEEKSGRWARALEHFGEFLERAPPDDDRRSLAARRRAGVEARIPRVRLAIGAVKPTSVRIDGVDVSQTLDTWLPLDPGEHRLDVHGSSGRPKTSTFSLQEREKLTLRLDVDSDRVVEPPARSAVAIASDRNSRGTAARPARNRANARAVGIALVGGGVAALVASLPATLLVLEKRDLVEEHCAAGRCDAEGLHAADAGKTWSLVSTVAVVLGVVGLASGAYVLAPDLLANTATRGATPVIAASF